ncbi:hypothetical protein RHSA111115_13920 [Rheinheimera salexigens]
MVYQHKQIGTALLLAVVNNGAAYLAPAFSKMLTISV